MSKLPVVKIPLDIVETFRYKLTRKNDGLVKHAQDIRWVEWNEDKTFNKMHESIEVGRSLILSPFSMSFSWLTTTVVEIHQSTENSIHFKTENSEYVLEWE